MPTIYNKLTLDGTTLLDLSQDTVANASHIRQGYVGHLNDGTQVTGTYSGSSYTLLASEELSVNTTSTTAITIPDSTMVMQRSNHYQTILYIQIRDKSGKRNGYFFGSDWYWTQPINGSQTNDYRIGRTLVTNSSGIVVASSTSTYGLYPQSPPTFSTDSVSVTIVARYNSSYSTTINGTYVVNVYSLAWPDNISPFA